MLRHVACWRGWSSQAGAMAGQSQLHGQRRGRFFCVAIATADAIWVVKNGKKHQKFPNVQTTSIEALMVGCWVSSLAASCETLIIRQKNVVYASLLGHTWGIKAREPRISPMHGAYLFFVHELRYSYRITQTGNFLSGGGLFLDKPLLGSRPILLASSYGSEVDMG